MKSSDPMMADFDFPKRPRLWIAGPPDEVLKAAATGLPGAIVTNPDVLAGWQRSEGRAPELTAAELAERTGLPVFVQLRGPDRDGFLRQAEAIRVLHPLLLPKLPATTAGFAAASALRDRKVLVTAVATLSQAVAAAAAGAAFICPYFARLRDAGLDPEELCRSSSDYFKATACSTELVPASLRSVADYELALRSGSSGGIVFTSLFREMLEHPSVESAMEGFEASWKRIDSSISCA